MARPGLPLARHVLLVSKFQGVSRIVCRPVRKGGKMKEPITSDESMFEEFDLAVYARCSNNNMPCFASFVPLTDEEQAAADDALVLS